MAIPISEETHKVTIGTGCDINDKEQFVNHPSDIQVKSELVVNYTQSGEIMVPTYLSAYKIHS